MTHNNPERPVLVDLLAAHREQQMAVPPQRTRRIDLAQIRSRLAAADPGQVDQMVEEVEKLRFGQEVFDLAREYLAAGKLDRARHWLRVAARHDVDDAEPLLADVEVIVDAMATPQAAAIADWPAHAPADAATDPDRHTASVDELHDAADVLRRAHAHARSIVRTSERKADEILAELRREIGPRDEHVVRFWDLNDLQRASHLPRALPFELYIRAQMYADWQPTNIPIRHPKLTRLLRAAGALERCDRATIWRPAAASETLSGYLASAATGTSAAELALAAVAATPIGLTAADYCIEVWKTCSATSPSRADTWRGRDSFCSAAFDSADRLWTPSDQSDVSHASTEQRPDREQIVAGPKFRQAIDQLRVQMAPPEGGLAQMASGRSA
jgi:hypothetical protein